MRKNKYTVYELQDEIKKIWSEELGKDLKINENYFLIGGNSLNAIRIVGEIKKLFDNSIDIPFSYIFSYPTVEKLSNAIYEILNGCLKAGLTSKELEMEVKLDIDLKGKSVPIKKEVCLLTGATGNLGNYLLKEILRQTNMEIYCLIRAKSMEAAQDRLEGVLNKINMSLYEEARVHIVLGDLGEPNLGMDMDVYEKLAEKVDCIYHNGAKVHFLSDYYELKNINVNGTKEIIRFAGYKKIKAIFYISTISIFSKFRTNDNIIMENDDISDPGILPIGYTQSKWVAEGLIWKAKECGIPVMVYRLGHVVGDSETGVCNDGDFIFRIIKSCLILGVYPDIKAWLTIISFLFLKAPFFDKFFENDAQKYTAYFVLFIVAALFNGFNVRDEGFGIFKNLNANPGFLKVWFTIVIVQAIIVNAAVVPFVVFTWIGNMFSCVPFGIMGWIITIVLSATMIPVDLLRKCLVSKK